MQSEVYTNLAQIYEHLMKYINYREWAKYIFDLIKFLEIEKPEVLELAAGNGKLAKHFYEDCENIVISDISKSMLNLVESFPNAKVCCNMTALPFLNKFNFIFAAFDSVNYLTTEEQFELMLVSVSKALKPKGFFTFDVSLKNNSLHFEKKLNRKGLYKGIKYIQKSDFFVDEKIHRNIFKIKLKNGSIVEESHYQKIYDFDYYFDSAQRNGFDVKHCFEAFSFNEAHHSTGRAQFILQKMS